MKNIIIALLISTSTLAFGQEIDCENFKNGKFEIIDAVYGNSIIERNGTTQTEYGENSELKLEFKVEWLNDCTYTLELTKVIENPKNIDLPDGMILTVEIIKTTENSYFQKSSSNLYDMTAESELIRIK